MINSTAYKIVIPFVCGAMVLGSAMAVSSVVAYKPYGVPDHRRQEYDDIIRKLQKQHIDLQNSKQSSDAIAVVDNREHDFGFIDAGTEGAKHDFVIRNQGSVPLSLVNAGSSCKCTVAEIHDPVVPPGESRNVTLVWNVGENVTDNYEQKAFIETNDPLHRSIELVVRGKVQSKWAYHGDDLTELAGRHGQPIVANCVIYSQHFSDFIVLETETSVPNIDVTVEPMSDLDRVALQATAGYQLRLEYRSTSQNALNFAELVRVNVFNVESEETAWIEVPIAGKFGKPVVFLGPDLDAATGLNLGTIERGTKQTWFFVARFHGDQEVRDAYIKGVEPKGIVATIDPIEGVRNTFRVTLNLADDAQPQRFSSDKQGYIEVADRAKPELSNWMPLRGEIFTAPHDIDL